jgi:hypothetical protein
MLTTWSVQQAPNGLDVSLERPVLFMPVSRSGPEGGLYTSSSDAPWPLWFPRDLPVLAQGWLDRQFRELAQIESPKPAESMPGPSADDKGQKQDPGIESSVPGIPVASPKIVRKEGQPPTIFYPPSRRSNKWVDAGEYLVGVDEGVEWQGKVAYYSLTHNLVVVDAKTQKTLWHSGDSAFWNTITFENLAKPNEAAQWAVVLKSTAYPEYSQCYDLNTGKRFALRGDPPKPPGTLTPRKHWSGSAGVNKAAVHTIVGLGDDWSKLRKRLFGDNPKAIPDVTDIDFTKEMLLVLYSGESSMHNGMSPALVVESDGNLVVRVKVHSYQIVLTGNSEIPVEHPYGLVILPRRLNTPVVLEYNEQVYIGAPEFWKEKERLVLKDEPPPDAKKKQ